MNVSDAIVAYLNERFGIRHFYGYQGTMVAFFADAVNRNPNVENHSCLNEQGASLAACGTAQVSGTLAAAYSTSGPGAVNLLQGVVNAYMDSTPVVFITGQANTYEYAGVPELRQQAFQEVDIVSMAAPVTKLAAQATDAESAERLLVQACEAAVSGRPGPVLIDLPMNVQQLPCEPFAAPDAAASCAEAPEGAEEECVEAMIAALRQAKRPVLLLGSGALSCPREELLALVEALRIPVATSLLARTALPISHPLNVGYVGNAYGMRTANLIAGKKADLVLAVGTSMCPRQVSAHFAQDAKVVRADLDPAVFYRHFGHDEEQFTADAQRVIAGLAEAVRSGRAGVEPFEEWASAAGEIVRTLSAFDELDEMREPNRAIDRISRLFPAPCTVAVDVGQHMMWSAQSMNLRDGQTLLFSGGHGAMGYALPAAIGAATQTGRTAVCLAGDGAFQMNIQELQWVVRERLPLKIVVLNNHALGMIVNVQRSYIDNRRTGTDPQSGFSSPSFAEVARAYGIRSMTFDRLDDFSGAAAAMADDAPLLVEIDFPEETFCYPKAHMGDEMWNQRPYLPADEMQRLLEL